MTSQTLQHTPCNERSVVVNVSQTEVEADVWTLPYPPEPSLKRRVPETLNSRGYFWKRRRTSEPIHGQPVDCPCVSPSQFLDAPMYEPWSNLESAYSTLPTSPPSPITPATEHPRKLSVVEFVEKLNTKLKRMFGTRRGSAEDEPPLPAPDEAASLAPVVRRRSSVSEHSHRLTEPPNFQPTCEELLWNGDTALSNVSLYFEYFGEPGPISYYITADWNIFQATLQAQRKNSTRAEMYRDMYYEADTDVQMSDRLRKHSTRSSGRKRKDSYFSFSDLWSKSRRWSKVDKGKGRQLSEDEDTTDPRKESIPHSISEHESDPVVLPLTEIGVLPRASTDGTSLLIPKQPLAVPEADFSSSRSGLPSLKFSSPSSSKSENPTPTSSPNGRASIRLVTTPPLGPPEVLPASSIGPSPSTTSLSSVNSLDDVDSPTPALRPTRTQSRLVRNRRAAAGAMPSGIEGRSRSLPIAIRSSTRTLGIAQTEHYSTPSPRHGDRPDIAPPSPSLEPTFVPSPEAMQSLTLGPPETPLAMRDGSSERLFNVSVDDLPVRQKDGGDEGFSEMTEGGSAVKRRTGTNLREAYVEQEEVKVEREREIETSPPPWKISPRKSVGQRCWWGGDVAP